MNNLMHMTRQMICVSLMPICLAAAPSAFTQVSSPPVIMTSNEAKQDMMRQLGIKSLIPGPSADEKAPNPANYDEAKASPFTSLPDPLVTRSGRKVTTAAQWQARRAEIIEDYEREVYGRVPRNAPAITWRVATTDREFVGMKPVIARRVIGHADNTAYPAISVDIRMMVVTPADAKGPVPMLIMYGRDDFPAPSSPSRADFERIDAALKEALISKDSSLRDVFAAHPAYMLQTPPAQFRMAQRDAHGDLPRPDQVIAAGWGYAMLDTDTIQSDSGAGLTRGVIGLANRGQPRKPDDWGVLRAWAWGASRAFDYLATDPTVDAKRIGVEGVSRNGKAALLAMAFDERFATVLVGSSGKGGATLLRRNFGEAVSSLASGMHYWMAGNFMKYDIADGAKPRTANDLPVDSHDLIALSAPRPVFISFGIPEQGDAHWLDHRGSLMAAVAAGPVYSLLGAKPLDVQGDWRTAVLPPVNEGRLNGTIAWRQHDGGHTDTPNLTIFLDWARAAMASKN